MRVTLVVLSWNGSACLRECLTAVLSQQHVEAEVLLVDNGSVDRSVPLVQQHFPTVQVAQNRHNLGFSAGMNVGMRLLRQKPQPPDVIVLLNQDTVVAPDWLSHLLEPFSDQAVGAVGCKIYYPDQRTLQHAGGIIEPGRAMTRHFGYGERDQGQYNQPRDLEFLTAAALALRMTALDKIGLFDEGYSPAYYEDGDLCWRLRRAGYRLRYQPTATLYHAESRSTRDMLRRSTLMHRNRLRFVVKTFPEERIWADFFTAECARMAAIPDSTEARTLRRAYLEGSLRIEEWLTARAQYQALPTATAQRLRRLCTDLRSAISSFQGCGLSDNDDLPGRVPIAANQLQRELPGR